MTTFGFKSAPTKSRSPFDYAVISEVFFESDIPPLLALFDATDGWQSRDEDFYRCALKEVTASVTPQLKCDLSRQMEQIVGHSLTRDVTVTAQRMTDGQRIGIHSDQPLLGYEFARLVVQLNPNWAPGDGGELGLYARKDGECITRLSPRWNTGFAFVLHPTSFHDVSETKQERRSLVFNFWHPGNTPELAATVSDLMVHLSFADLPEALQTVADEAEARLDEETTYGASVTSWILTRWGFSEGVVIDGYRYTIGASPLKSPTTVEHIAITWADWVARLYRGTFCPALWQVLAKDADRAKNDVRLKAFGKLLFPTV